ncbi:MAG TPA: RsmB/NOP family class I SAM-dependent RNA methyltransferase [Dongiaceae bacterium]|nr:RsmB/NOP family class I SAM-dependent RNA methyltransferase [Dongiaceae bacterium]
MMPGARIQAAIELLQEIHGGTAPADRAAAAYFRNRRYIGGKDRRDVLDHAYGVLRRRAALDWWIARAVAQESGVEIKDVERARVIAKLLLLDGWSADRLAGSFDGGQYRPAMLDNSERRLVKALAGQPLNPPEQPQAARLEYPGWIESQLREVFGERLDAEMAATLDEAATDLRVNALKATRAEAIKALAADGVEAVPTALSPLGLRVKGRPPLATLNSFKSGLIEVQDEGSQLVALLADARPGMRVVDFCAGAGGKTLALAAQMQNKGKLVACDVLQGRVDRAATRLNRAGVFNVERLGLSSERDPWVKRHAGGFDRVLVDAPCSGTGTWRRNPDARWRLKPGDIAELSALQRRIIDSAARLVKPGGRMIYATCSLLPAENADHLAWIAEHLPDFELVPLPQVWQEVMGAACPVPGDTLSLTPARNGTDGFFTAVFQRRKTATVDTPGEDEPGGDEPGRDQSDAEEAA